MAALSKAGDAAGAIESAARMWDRWWTPYHDVEHLLEGLAILEQLYKGQVPLGFEAFREVTREELDSTVIAWMLHDAIYDVRSETDEVQSAKLVESLFPKAADPNRVRSLILGTQDHSKLVEISPLMARLDLMRLMSGDVEVHSRTERQIFREYGIYPVDRFKPSRINALYNLRSLVNLLSPNSLIDHTITKLTSWRPRVAVMAGSFDPFHVGHLSVLEQSERIFDKVVIAVGVNPSKDTADRMLTKQTELSKLLRNREVVVYGANENDLNDKIYKVPTTVGLVELFEQSGMDVTLVRGHRNAADLEFESMMYAYNKAIKPDLNCIFFHCDANIAHVSSSGIRVLAAADPEEAKRYLASDEMLSNLRRY